MADYRCVHANFMVWRAGYFFFYMRVNVILPTKILSDFKGVLYTLKTGIYKNVVLSRVNKCNAVVVYRALSMCILSIVIKNSVN